LTFQTNCQLRGPSRCFLSAALWHRSISKYMTWTGSRRFAGMANKVELVERRKNSKQQRRTGSFSSYSMRNL
jgi:hypothetical protein